MTVTGQIHNDDNCHSIREFIDLMEAYYRDGTMVKDFHHILAGRCRTFFIDKPGMLAEMLVAGQLCDSKGEAKRLISGGGVRAGGVKVKDPKAVVSRSQFDDGWLRLEVGKCQMCLFVLDPNYCPCGILRVSTEEPRSP